MGKLKHLGVTWIALAAFIVFLLWAAFYELDQTVRAVGQMVPGTRTQVIQSADGGVLEKLLVQEGQTVRSGQVLAILEKERANAGVEEARAKVASLQAALERARAEAAGRVPDFKAIAARYIEFVHEQKALYQQRRQSLDDELASLQETYELARNELLINQKLMETGDISQIELMRSQRQVAEIKGRQDAVRNKYLQDSRQEASKLQDELSSQKFKLDERMSVLSHTELTSPVDGVVKTLRMNTLGGVLRAGDELMQISPTDVELLAEVKINPADVGLLRVGLPVSVKVDAFDYTIYGALDGTLSYISSDTLSDQAPNGQTIASYKVRVTLNAKHGNPKLQLSALKPGMTVSTDILTGRRSILLYLTKPISKAFQGAASQR